MLLVEYFFGSELTLKPLAVTFEVMSQYNIRPWVSVRDARYISKPHLQRHNTSTTRQMRKTAMSCSEQRREQPFDAHLLNMERAAFQRCLQSLNFQSILK